MKGFAWNTSVLTETGQGKIILLVSIQLFFPLIPEQDNDWYLAFDKSGHSAMKSSVDDGVLSPDNCKKLFVANDNDNH